MKFSKASKNILVAVVSISFMACSNASLYKGIYSNASTASINFCTTPANTSTPDLKYIFVFDNSNSTKQNFIPDDWTGPGAPYSLGNPYYTSPDFAVDPLLGTDMYGEKRFGTLIRYLKSITDTPQTFYSVIEFGDTPVDEIDWTNAGVKTPLASVISYLGTQCATNQLGPSGPTVDPNCTGGILELGNTNYEGTLSNPQNTTDTSTVYGKIYRDINDSLALKNAGLPYNPSAYVIIWVSDGVPYVINGATGSLQLETDILGRVSAIVNLATLYPEFVQSVTFNTGFFHIDHTVPAPADPGGETVTGPNTLVPWNNPNPGAGITIPGSPPIFFPAGNGIWQYAEVQDEAASTYMSDMAATGKGQFIDFAGNVINYGQFSVPTQTLKYQLTNFWIHDASTVWWPDAQGHPQLMLDSDQDGIPDLIELQMGSNPNKYDSDGNGLGDGVELAIYGTPCGGPTCAAGQRRVPAPGVGSANGVNTCAYKIATANPNILDSDCDFLNDYEENILHSNSLSMDSNNDGVPDQFEWISKVLFLPNTNSLTAIPENDGYTDLQKLKYNYPINFPVSSLVGYTPLSYTMVQTSDNALQTCYAVNLQSLATMSNADTIRAYVVESQGAGGTIQHYRTAQKVMSSSNLVLTDSDFK